MLHVTTGLDVTASPEQAWDEWQHYNELVDASAEEVVCRSYEESLEVMYYPEAPVLYGQPTPGEFKRTRRSCFVAGTHVWTQGGPVPIETIVEGDLVLSQNPTTGEVAYRPVLQTTVGPPTGVLNIRLRGETIGATLGHRFWVNGPGWMMAKSLEPSAHLHALGGVVEVIGVETGERVDCHNLVVDGFHTFFVGQSKVLVHDFTCPAPAVPSVPGSTTPRRAVDRIVDRLVEVLASP